MTYNMTNVTDANNVYETYVAVNQLSHGYIALFTLFTIFLLMFIVYKKYEEDTKKVLLASTTLTAIIAILMWTIDLIGWNIVIYPIIGLFASLIIYKFSE